jgi:cellulose synthase (UDP-forming)
MLVLLCLGVGWELRQVRKHHRIITSEPTFIRVSGSQAEIEGEVQDVSIGGLNITTAVTVDIPEKSRVTMRTKDSYGNEHIFELDVMRVFKRGDKIMLGCKFTSFDVREMEKIVSFIYGDSLRWEKFWSIRSYKSAGSFKSLAYLFAKGIKGAHRNFRGVLLPLYKKWNKFMEESWKIVRRKKSIYAS